MKILAAGDEPAIRFSLAERLQADRHEVHDAAHAPAALKEDLVVFAAAAPWASTAGAFRRGCGRWSLAQGGGD